jgi:peptidoglycan hydrolase-like protein with peptidoglycan-binding domain
MAVLTRASFPTAPQNVARNNAQGRGWGTGWPHCQSGKWAKVSKAGVIIITRREVAELVATLLQITELLKYDVKKGQTWGAACRAIKGTNSPSNHSWGLAVDVNSLANPMSTKFKTDIPPKVVEAWWDCGWYWGGWYQNRPDTMHFEYVGKPSDVARHLKKAKAMLAELKAPSKWRKRVNAKPGSRIISIYDQGDDVALVQRFLGVKPDDGKFDAELEKEVRAYQKMRKIKVDGIVGPATWKPILNAVSGA